MGIGYGPDGEPRKVRLGENKEVILGEAIDPCGDWPRDFGGDPDRDGRGSVSRSPVQRPSVDH